MTISKRTFLKVGAGATLASVASPLMALEGESGLIIALLAAAAVADGEGAPKPTKFKFTKREVSALNEAGEDKAPDLLAQMLRGKMANEWSVASIDLSGNDIRKAMGGKGLAEGEHVVQALSKGPKWEIKITIVIKF